MKKLFCFLLVLLLSARSPYIYAENDSRQDPLKIKIFTIQHGRASSLINVVEQMKSPGGKVTVHDASNNIILYDHPEVIERISIIIDQLDQRQQQVDITVLITETSGSFLGRIGLSSTQSVIPMEKFNKMRYLINNDVQTSIRSEMTIKTLSGQPAALQVAQEEIYPGSVHRDDSYTLITPTRTRSAGSFIEVLPKVNNDGTILIEIAPKMSEFLDDRSSRERTILTKVIIDDGDTIALGGVNSMRQETTQNKIPLTGISVTSNTNTPRNTIMFLTVNIVKD